MARLESLNDERRVELVAGAGADLEQGEVRAFESLHQLKDQLWAVYLDGRRFRLHVANGFPVRRNGVVTGGGTLEAGDVIDAGDGAWRFVDGDAWPGARDPVLDERTRSAPHDDELAVVYRDWALERGSAIAESLRRPVTRDEVARHLFSLAPLVADGVVSADFAGPFIRRVTARSPGLDLEAFVAALARCGQALPHLEAVRTVGLPVDDEPQLALLLARDPALQHVARLEVGHRGHWALADFRDDGVAPRHPPPRAGPARPMTLVLTAWDGWTSVEPLTREGQVRLDADVGLVPLESGFELTPGASAPVQLRRLADWVLEVAASTPPNLRPRFGDSAVIGSLGLLAFEAFELCPGLRCHLAPAS